MISKAYSRLNVLASGLVVSVVLKHIRLSRAYPIMFSLQNKTISLQPQSPDSPVPQAGASPKAAKANIGAIVAGVVGGIAAASIAAASVIYYRRRRSAARRRGVYRTSITGTTTEQRLTTSSPPYSDSDDREQDSMALGNVSRTTELEGVFHTQRLTKAREAGRAVTGEEHCGPTEVPSFQTQYSTSESDPASLLSTDAARIEERSLSSHSGQRTSTVIHSPTATEDVVVLRAEVQNLRRVMEQIRVERFESPPEYQDHEYH